MIKATTHLISTLTQVSRYSVLYYGTITYGESNLAWVLMVGRDHQILRFNIKVNIQEFT